MKKLSALIAMVLCLTIGGVYAAWTYTNSAKDVADVYEAYTVTLSTATEEGAHGEYGIESNISKLTIDQNGTEDPSKDYHKAVLNIVTTDGEAPYIKITLDLAEKAPSDDVVFATLVSTYDLRFVDVGGNYLGNPIFNDKKAGTTEINWVVEDATNRIFSYTITDFASEFELNDFVLKSKTEHTAFGAALGNPTLRIDVSDGTAA